MLARKIFYACTEILNYFLTFASDVAVVYIYSQLNLSIFNFLESKRRKQRLKKGSKVSKQEVLLSRQPKHHDVKFMLVSFAQVNSYQVSVSCFGIQMMGFYKINILPILLIVKKSPTIFGSEEVETKTETGMHVCMSVRIYAQRKAYNGIIIARDQAADGEN